jgi:asparagine synthase (glutamine-hydrolysing)
VAPFVGLLRTQGGTSADWMEASAPWRAASPSGRYRIFLAGELRYRFDLARRLGLLAQDARSLDDAALVANAWDRWDDEALRHLEGEFSLAVFDARDRALTIAQSVFSKGPLYYVDVGEGLAFATRVRLLLERPGVACVLDEVGFARAMSQYQIQAIDPGQTCFRGIRRLPVASALRISQTGRRAWEYWSPDPEARTPFESEADVHHEVRERLRASVADRVRDHARVACLLSGGLDSSSLTALAVEALGGPSRVVGVSAVLSAEATERDESDERPHIDVMRRHLGIDVIEVVPPDEPGPWQFPQSFFDDCEVPVHSPRHYVYRALSSASASVATVVLDGAYGELGPSSHGRPTVGDRLRRTGWSGLGHVLAVRAEHRRTHRSSGRLAAPLPPRAAWLLGCVREEVLQSTGLAQSMEAASGPERRPSASGRETCIGYPPDWRKTARGSAGLLSGDFDVQYPFRDRRIWEYCAGLPRRLAWRAGFDRYLLRAAMAGVLPQSIQWRESRGAFSADHFVRLHRGLRWARDVAAGVQAQEPAARLLDLEWLRGAIDRVDRAPATERHLALSMLLQGTLLGIQYLRWFDEVAGRATGTPLHGPADHPADHEETHDGPARTNVRVSGAGTPCPQPESGWPTGGHPRAAG